MFEKEILDTFKVMVVEKNTPTIVNYTHALDGFITDFNPSNDQLDLLLQHHKPLDVNTLFTVEERKTADPFDLLTKQILHYVEVYGIDQPGAFKLIQNNGTAAVLNMVRGVTIPEFNQMIWRLIYTNAPIKDSKIISKIIQSYSIEYDINLVKNNELRVILFDGKQTFNSGDDAVRYICYSTTDDPMLIKSKEVLDQVSLNNSKISNDFLERHSTVLAKVFNRHKRIILSLKNKNNSSIINRIGRLSKTLHVPMNEPIEKRFISKALLGKLNQIDHIPDFTTRDLFKFLNYLEYKKLNLSDDVFVIRNGKLHLKGNRFKYDKPSIILLQNNIILELKNRFSHLKNKKILLDEFVHYGLPISRKQSLGNLPFGTKISVEGDSISAGVYWENSWGATDLDLSTVDIEGNRVGWGQLSGYEGTNILFSGDVTYAPDGVGGMEFMTSKKDFSTPYGLYVNIFSGSTPSSMELVIGDQSKGNWITNVKIREKHTLNSRGNIIGFVRDGKFVVFSLRMNNNSSDFNTQRTKALVSKALPDYYNINELFALLGIEYDIERKQDKYDYDLSYSNFSFDKLEDIFYK